MLWEDDGDDHRLTGGGGGGASVIRGKQTTADLVPTSQALADYKFMAKGSHVIRSHIQVGRSVISQLYVTQPQQQRPQSVSLIAGAFGCISNKSRQIRFVYRKFIVYSAPAPCHHHHHHLFSKTRQQQHLNWVFVHLLPVFYFLSTLSGITRWKCQQHQNQICISVTFPAIKILTIYVKSEIQLLLCLRNTALFVLLNYNKDRRHHSRC